MKVECICGKWHDITPTGLALVVFCYQNLSLLTMNRNGPTPMCMAEAFSDESLVEMFRRRYPGNLVGINTGGKSGGPETGIEEIPTQKMRKRQAEGTESSKLEAGTGTESSQETGSEARRSPQQAT